MAGAGRRAAVLQQPLQWGDSRDDGSDPAGLLSYPAGGGEAEGKEGPSLFPTFQLFQRPGRKFCLELAKPIPAVLQKKEAFGGSFMSN